MGASGWRCGGALGGSASTTCWSRRSCRFDGGKTDLRGDKKAVGLEAAAPAREQAAYEVHDLAAAALDEVGELMPEEVGYEFAPAGLKTSSLENSPNCYASPGDPGRHGNGAVCQISDGRATSRAGRRFVGDFPLALARISISEMNVKLAENAAWLRQRVPSSCGVDGAILPNSRQLQPPTRLSLPFLAVWRLRGTQQRLRQVFDSDDLGLRRRGIPLRAGIGEEPAIGLDVLARQVKALLGSGSQAPFDLDRPAAALWDV